MKIETALTRLLGIRLPVIMAPMFLVSNRQMMEAAMRSGIMGVFPSLNFREKGTLEEIINILQEFSTANGQGSFGVNLIVQKTNPLFEKHLEICVAGKVPFYIT